LILQTNSDYNIQIKEALEKDKNNYIAALRRIPKRLLLLYVHSFQSYVWNKTLYKYLKENNENTLIPLVGFGTELADDSVSIIIKRILIEEKLSERDFINRKFPMLSLEGNSRNAIVEIQNLAILEQTENQIKLNFKLNKGSFATVALSHIFNKLDTFLVDFI